MPEFRWIADNELAAALLAVRDTFAMTAPLIDPLGVN